MGGVRGGLDALVLSHGHYDHTGGAAALLTGELRPRTVYLGPDFFGERYTTRQDGQLDISSALERETLEPTGVPWPEEAAEKLDLGGGLRMV